MAMHFSVLSLAFLMIDIVHTSDCGVCVLEPLLTSLVKCPVCIENAADGNRRNAIRQDSKSTANSCSQTKKTTCSVPIQSCNASYKYRTIDGSCNNVNDPSLGMADTIYPRLLPAHYKDHKHSYASDSNGQPLPLSRALRTALFPDRDVPDNVSLAVMQWGQIVAHDISWSVMIPEMADCCNSSFYDDRDICFPIQIPEDDYFYSRFNITCLNLTRNKFAFTGSDNESQPRQQSNSATHAIDLSLVYGSSLRTANSVRKFKRGRLRTQSLTDGRVFLPNVPASEVDANCYIKSANEPCYVGGDDRVTQNTQLTALQILLVRQHNRVAERLQQLHKDWNDEIIFQETRNIMVALVQHITYNEWLVYYLGDEIMNRCKLYPKKLGYTQYKADINFVTLSSFAGAAFRFSHSGIQGSLSMLNYRRETQRSIPLSDWMTRPMILQQDNNYDQLLLGLTDQPMQVLNNHFTDQLTNLMFHNEKPYGLDLMSIDIERGRDYGLAPYTHYLEVCTGYKTTKFQDLHRVIPKEHVRKLERFYNSVKDIDLMVGGSLENAIAKTRLGPTFLCITTEQFYRKKWGDRFWYEVENQLHSFSEPQLGEIRKASLSRFICDNSDNITHIAVNSFIPPSPTNKIVPCSSIPAIDLDKWK